MNHTALDGSMYFVRDKTLLIIVFNEIYYFRLFKKNIYIILNYKTVQENNRMFRRIITPPIYVQLLLLLKKAFFRTTIRVDNSFDTAMNDWNRKKIHY